ncbi:uncharacterized protein LOC130732717 [Lotus japonicus]|uniref:uncharacterized protein LOC130732717 n=1 Tax=Lotus japonicus TaxID=34305 RepID=UPI002590FACC|nr:uncharacterized protein LOC130732717 [Lotus japonicus]
MSLIQNQNHGWNHESVHVTDRFNPSFRRNESFGYHPLEQHHYNYTVMMERRQRFLRSYQFSRKKSLTEKIKGSLIRVKKVLWGRLRSARRVKRLVFSMFRIKCGFYRRRRWFSRLLNVHKYRTRTDLGCC